MEGLDKLAHEVDAFEQVDTATFQRKARVLQSLWRIEMGFPAGKHRGRVLGSRLAMPWARDTLSNFLTDEIRQVVREEVLDPARRKGKLYRKPRLFDNLLSSQPLVFNLFGVLSRHLDLATQVFSELTNGRCQRVTRVEFEHSPGRGNIQYTGDHSAFDVYVEFDAADGKRGFAGIEVKYHESLQDKPSDHHARYDEVADAMGCFREGCRDALRAKPLQQIWRDHLLAGSLMLADGFDGGVFVFLSPAGNEACNRAVAAYRDCLVSGRTFEHWTAESVVSAIREYCSEAWVGTLWDRYLDFAKVDDRLRG